MPKRLEYCAYGLLVTVTFVLFLLMPHILNVQMGLDWSSYFRPRALRPEDPYSVGPTAYPPWLFTLMAPIAALPAEFGYAFLWTVSVMALAAYTKKWWRTLLLVLCWPVLDGLQLGQIDALLVLALMLPPNWALVVVLTKPTVMLPWALRSVQKTGHFSWAIEPAVYVVAISLALWGNWLEAITTSGLGMSHPRICAWPYLVPFGVLLLTRKKERPWLVAGAFLTPYLNPYNLTPVLAHIYKEERWWVPVSYTHLRAHET